MAKSKRKLPLKKVGRKPKLDPVAVASAMTELRGNVAGVAQRFNVTRQAVASLIEKTPPLQEVQRDAREGMKDNAESALYRAVLNGEAWAVCFYLKTQAKDRGYIERSEVEQVAKMRLVIEEEVISGSDPGSPQEGPAAPGAI